MTSSLFNCPDVSIPVRLRLPAALPKPWSAKESSATKKDAEGAEAEGERHRLDIRTPEAPFAANRLLLEATRTAALGGRKTDSAKTD